MYPAVPTLMVPPLGPTTNERLNAAAAMFPAVVVKVPPLRTTVVPAPSVEALPSSPTLLTESVPPLMVTGPVKSLVAAVIVRVPLLDLVKPPGPVILPELRSEEHTSELQSLRH